MESKGKLTISMNLIVLADCKIRAAKVDKSISQYIEDLIVQDINTEPVIQYGVINRTKKLKRKGAAGNGGSNDEQT